jgi:DNA-directed RNA polymerase specialized sigma24 family protein
VNSRSVNGMTKREDKQGVKAEKYATAADFKQIFTEEIDSLYLLSLLLTGDHEKARQCFVEGIGESVKGNRVFKEWARTWARRSIIQGAIRLINPREHSVPTTPSSYVAQAIDKVPVVLEAEIRAILELAPLERFVFVMSVLERFSPYDCSLMLGCARRDVETARTRAMQRLVTLLGLMHNRPADANPETVIEPIIAQHFAAPAWIQSLSR